jgi:hypothetical protein
VAENSALGSCFRQPFHLEEPPPQTVGHVFTLTPPPPLPPQRPILAPRALSPEWTPLDLPSRVMARGIYGTVSPTSLRVYLPRLPFSVSFLSILVVLPLRFSSLSSSF